MSPARFVVAVLLVCAFSNVGAEFSLLSKAISWTEDVMGFDGQMIAVERTATFAPVQTGIALGGGGLQTQSIRFTHDGKKVVWESEDTWPINFTPDVLDFVDGVPVIVVPVHRWTHCYKYGFPPEGFAALAYRNGRWERMPAADLPKELRINLLRNVYDLRYKDAYKGKKITLSDKLTLDSDGAQNKQGAPLAEVGKTYASYSDSCIRLRPPENRELAQRLQRSVDASRNAPSIRAEVVSVRTESESITDDMIREQRGVPTGGGYLNGSCGGRVRAIESLIRTSGNATSYGSELYGYQLVLESSTAETKKVQVDGSFGNPIQSVTCDRSTIFVIKREDRATLIVHRLKPDGDLVDAFRVTLPEAAKTVAERGWWVLWTASPDGSGNLSLSIVEYAPGTIKRKVICTARMPVV